VTFTDDDVRLFSAASHDRNPLHLDEAYSHRTAFGEPVIFGVLGALAALGQVPVGKGHRIRRLVVEFPRPLFKAISYRIENRLREPLVTEFALMDGRQACVRGVLTVERGACHQTLEGGPPLAEATEAGPAIAHGTVVQGRYAPEQTTLGKLRTRLGAEAPIFGDAITALLWCSYFTGMVVPGTQALFSRLSLELVNGAAITHGPLEYRAEVVVHEARLGVTHVRFTLTAGGLRWAIGELRAFIRPTAVRLASPSLLGVVPSLSGKVAVIIGASRGLGASLAAALSGAGCAVYGSYRRSASEAEALVRTGASSPAPITMVRGDAADPAFCRALLDQVVNGHGGLDYLFCNAAPPLHPLWIEPDAVERVERYVVDGLALVIRPLATMLESLSVRSGRVVLSSSVAIEHPPAEWPHYVALKQAAEGLLATAAAEYESVSFVSARFPKLRTDFGGAVASPGAMPPAVAVARLLEVLAEAPNPGKMRFIPFAS
jgi:NAD(P)-dependent dehydrogenase (short-subunit alcohol dehydrogenase family)